MFTNGIVIQKYVDNSYKGIDGSGFSENTGKNWFLNDDEILAPQFEPYYDEYIGKTYWNLEKFSWISACNDLSYIRKYINEAQKRNIKFRLLLCESYIPNPIFDASNLKTEFLGYDYAYANGDNYSAVYNEIPFVFSEFKLNQYGLFQTEEEISEYIAKRELFKQQNPPYTLEDGEFVVFRLCEIVDFS